MAILETKNEKQQKQEIIEMLLGHALNTMDEGPSKTVSAILLAAIKINHRLETLCDPARENKDDTSPEKVKYMSSVLDLLTSIVGQLDDFIKNNNPQ